MSSGLVYTQQLIPYTREQLIEKVRRQMKEKRFKHVLRVEATALALAEQYNGDLEKTSIAALTHDYAKERPDDEMAALVAQGVFEPELLAYGNPIWHAELGAYLAEQELGLKDETILQAIRLHTIGSAEMTLLDKLIYVADYIEPGRKFPGVDRARQLARENLDAAVRYESKHTLLHLVQTNAKIYPKAIETYNQWVAT
ncbi:bis(5'-nucleosyl)-tetraphosphatase (symmetrical) YqeK [Vagococcus acidifermentans]|uniref:bis(5'-nucleosyl)-tetraphosphatase (symmetrical) n=1 Tax=Vagococcus acidifermentans TaxID=564710 RepID=A0A430APP1_9ENTE|nr:bis(5'-nucleosyl)-tetraphosphatase (symmetrical) YqeK [Vagococcus acidifermentans]RSU10091.1 HD domain-containing protein [Vagococcus acidifermentans]